MALGEFPQCVLGVDGRHLVRFGAQTLRSEAKSSLEAKTELLQAAKVNAEGFKNDATLRRTVADAIHKVYHK